jgi:HKD family nuclease
VLIVQNGSEPATVRNAIVDLIAAGVVDMRIASAYVTFDGCDILLAAVEGIVGPNAFASMPKTLVTSFDYGITDPAALKRWQTLENGKVFVSGGPKVLAGSLMPTRAFHPKLYAFGRDAKTYNVLVGSANLTGRGFSVNTEAGWAQENVSKSDIDKAIERTLFDTASLTDELLAAYEALRKSKPPPPEIEQEAQPVPQPSHVNLGSLPLFRLAIENNEIAPASYEAMWIQGEALQGGSRNQLELPRGAHRFFAYVFDQYDYPDKITIGQPLLRSGAQIWSDRLLTWHGNNKMERMNLPTLAQGGFNYADTAVMFRRLKDGSFELIVTPWESNLARSWRQASAQRHTLFRLGTAANSRIVGLL